MTTSARKGGPKPSSPAPRLSSRRKSTAAPGDLQAALDQKVALLHEVDHRVKNNLQVISSLILLKARRIGDPAAQGVLHSLAERIAALSTVTGFSIRSAT